MKEYNNLSLNELLKYTHDHAAWYWLGMAYWERGDFNNAAVWLEKTMNDTGNKWAGKATLNLGYSHQGGLHPRASKDEALRLFEKIPKFVRAKLNAGILYFNGTETKHNPAKGKKLIEEALEELQKLEGYDREKFFSQSEWYDIGWMYYKENNPKAYKYFEKAIANCDTNYASDRKLIELIKHNIDVLRRDGV
jgi:tetratricopeptide (TPR) repeat protein